MGKRKVIFRADGNLKIGMGHVMRSLALAEMLKNDFHCSFATRSPSSFIKKEILNICNEILILPDNKNHYQNFLAHLEGHEIVVLDNYFFDTLYQSKIKNKGCKLVCIDDLQDKHFLADIIINPAININIKLYKCEKYTKILNGLKYSLLRGSFLKNAKLHNSIDNDIASKSKEVVIYAGGVLKKKIYSNFISFCESENDIKKIHLIVNKHSNISNSRKVIYYKNLSENELLNLFKKVSFGIFPSSTISIEACASRLPFITGYFVENQINIYNGLINSGLAIGTGNWFKNNCWEIKSAIDKIVQKSVKTKIIKNQIKQLDGKSNERILNVFTGLS